MEIVIDNKRAYQTLGDALARAGAAIDVPELHGGLCAALCVGGAAAARTWIDDCLADAAQDDGRLDEVREPLAELELHALQSLAGTDMAFTPLLPDDEQDLAQRVRALALWCHGFVTGLGLAGLELDARSERVAEIAEIIGDFAEISKAAVGNEDLEYTNQSEFSLAELVEYVRVGVQIVYEELGEGRGLDTLH